MGPKTPNARVLGPLSKGLLLGHLAKIVLGLRVPRQLLGEPKRGTHGRGALNLGSWGGLGRLREAQGVLGESLFMGPPYMGPPLGFPKACVYLSGIQHVPIRGTGSTPYFYWCGVKKRYQNLLRQARIKTLYTGLY